MRQRESRKTGWVVHEHYMWHDTQRFNLLVAPSLTVQPGDHAENEETKRRFRNLVEVSSLDGKLVTLKPRKATEPELLRFHTNGHLEKLRKLTEAGGGLAGPKTPVGPASYEIAKLAVGGVLEAIDAVMTKKVDNAYVLCRPPGHHADAEEAHGFCLLANGVLGAKHAKDVHDLKRIAIIDWDVHHGNSAETAFYDDPDVLTVSVHQDNLFPLERGKVDEVGSGKGRGANLNIPLPSGSGSEAYRTVFDEVIIPAIRQFKPELILVASGFDASAMDPLGHMMLSSLDYRYMAEKLVDVADDICDGRLVMTHEGGYSAAYVPYCGLAVLETLSGIDAEIEDPFVGHISRYGGQSLAAHQRQAIDAALRHLSGNH